MDDNIHYFEKVNNNIGYANILSKIPDKNKDLVIKLLTKRKNIQEKNGLFAYWQLKKIDSKIEKLKFKNLS